MDPQQQPEQGGGVDRGRRRETDLPMRPDMDFEHMLKIAYFFLRHIMLLSKHNKKLSKLYV
jgi:hypothetical protein